MPKFSFSAAMGNLNRNVKLLYVMFGSCDVCSLFSNKTCEAFTEQWIYTVY